MLVGGKLTEEQKKKIEESNKKRISDAANMEIEYEPGTIPPTTRDITVPFKSSTTTPVTTAPVSGKKVIRLEENGTNDYYEVDVDNNGKPIFNTKVKLDDTQKKDYSNKYYFNEPPTVTSNPTLDAPASVTAINKKGNSSIVERKATTKTDSPQVTRNKELQKELNKEGYKLDVDGIIGTATYNALNSSKNFTKDLRHYSKTYPELKHFMSKSVTSDTPTIDISVIPPGNNPVDSTKTATDSSFINKMFKDTLGVTIDTAKLQKPAPKKVITAPSTPPSMNKGTDTNGGIIQAQRQVEEGVKRGIKPRGLTGYEKIDRFQDDVSALSTAASLTGVGGLPAKVVDIADAALDAGQFAYAYATGNKPEMLNQGIQTGMRVVLPLAARGAGKAIQKYSPAAEEIGYRIGKSKVGEKIIAPIFNKNSMSKYNTVGVQVIDDMQKVPGYMSRIDNDVVEAGKAAKIFMKKVNSKTNPAEVAQAKSALKRYEDALLASNKKDITEMEAMRREMAGQKFNKDAASKQATYKQASAVKAVEEAKIPKLKTDGLGTEWKWQGENTAKLIAEQEALLAKARTLPEVKRINEQLKKLYSSKVIHLKPIKVPSVKKQLGGYYFM